MLSVHLLSLAIWVPILVGVLVLILGKLSTRWVWLSSLIYPLSLMGAVLGLAVTIPLLIDFHSSSTEYQFIERYIWIERLNIFYHLGVDGISILLLPLTALMSLLVVYMAPSSVTSRLPQYLGCFLILSGLLIGSFCAMDGALFYVFFEATLIPMYVVIGVWGGDNRVYAAFKFFLYTLAGSLLMLVAILYLYHTAGNSFDIRTWQEMPLSLSAQKALFIAFFFAFAVKVPMWPLHTWLPDAHVQAPTGGSVILAAIMLKLGAYGFLRFTLPILPDISRIWADGMIWLSLIAVIYVGCVALVQTDIKKLIAYSSVAHMGFVTLSCFMFVDGELVPAAVEGGIMQMISHGFVSGALFFCVGVLYDRMHTRELSHYGGVASTMPRLTFFAVLFAMANCGLPGTSGFVGEFKVILGAMRYDFWVAFLAGTTLILGAAYSLWMVKQVFWGKVVHDTVASLPDLNWREFSTLSVLAIIVLYVGCNPRPLTEITQGAVYNLTQQAARNKLEESHHLLPTSGTFPLRGVTRE